MTMPAAGTLPRTGTPAPLAWGADAVVLAALAVGGMLAYANSFTAPFVFDGNPLVRNLQILRWESPERWLTLRPRFIGYLTFDLNYTLHGERVEGYHAINLAIHVAAAALLYALAKRFTSVPVAACAAAVFLLHPMQTQSVTYIYQRFEALMGMFLLAGLLCLVRAADGKRPVPWLVGSFACYVLSTCSKEVGVVAPLLYLWFDRVFLAGSWRELWARRRYFHLAMVGSLGLGGCLVYHLREHYAGGGLLCPDQVGVLEYALIQPGVVLHYLRQFVVPFDLCADEAWPVENRPTRLALTIVGLLIAGGGFACLVSRYPQLAFLVGSPLLILAPTSSVAPIVDLSFTHRTYATLAPLAVLVALGLDRVTKPLNLYLRPRLFALAAFAVATTLTMATAWRNTVYTDPICFWSDVVAKAPHNLRGLSNLGLAHAEAGDEEGAIACYTRAVSLWFEAEQPAGSSASRTLQRVPGRFTAVVNPLLQLGIRATAAGDLAEATRLFEALVHLPRLPTTNDEPAKVFYNYALLLRKLGKPHEAERSLRHALSCNAGYGSAYNELALLLADSGRFDEAVEPLTTALALPLPAERRARYAFNLASIHVERGDLSAAERQLAIACVAAPSQADYARALEAVRSRRSKDVVDPEAQTPTTATSQEAVP